MGLLNIFQDPYSLPVASIHPDIAVAFLGQPVSEGRRPQRELIGQQVCWRLLLGQRTSQRGVA